MELVGKRLEQDNPTLNAGFGAQHFSGVREDVGKELRRNS